MGNIKAILSDAGGILFDDRPGKVKEFYFINEIYLPESLPELTYREFMDLYYPFKEKAQTTSGYSKDDALFEFLSSLNYYDEANFLGGSVGYATSEFKGKNSINYINKNKNSFKYFKNDIYDSIFDDHFQHYFSKERKGVRGRTHEQMSIDSRKAGRKGAIAKGLTPWTNEETEFAHQLSQQPEYQWEKGSNNPGRPNNGLIALELNIQYHNCEEVRTSNKVSQRLIKYRKSLIDNISQNNIEVSYIDELKSIFKRFSISYNQKNFKDPSSLVFEDTLETLDEIRESGIDFIILTDATRGEKKSRKDFYDPTGISVYLTDLISSSDIGVKKPHPDFFNYALNKHNLNIEEVLFIAHDLDEISGAHDFGLDVIAYRYKQEIEPILDQLDGDELGKIYRLTNFSDLLKLIENVNSTRDLDQKAIQLELELEEQCG